MTIDYILFEKKSENDRPVWNSDLVKEFCEDQKYDYQEIKDETLFVVVRLVPIDENPDNRYRMLEITKTITFIMKDDPSLDDLMHLEEATKPLPKIEDLSLKVEEEEKEQFSYT